MTADNNLTFNVMDIIRGTTVDGPGFRTSIYLAGCSHRCPGCHNPSTWNEHEGSEMTLAEILEIVREEDFDVTLTGGDPLFNPEACAILAEEIKKAGYGLWIYTGYTWEEIVAEPRFAAILQWTDVIVDGPFIEALKDPDLLFRGSSNQRLIDIPRTLAAKEVITVS